MVREILKNLISKKPSLPFPEGFRLSPEEAAKIVALQKKVDAIFGRSLRIRQVDAGSCNACEWECTALTNPIYDIQRFFVNGQVKTDPFGISLKCLGMEYLSRLIKFRKKLLMKKGRR